MAIPDCPVVIGIIDIDGSSISLSSPRILGYGKTGVILRETDTRVKKIAKITNSNSYENPNDFDDETANENNRYAISNEANAYQRLEKHPGIPLVFSASPNGIEMEWLNGETLLSYIKSHPEVTDDCKRLWMRTSVETILELHRCGITHEDYKLGNIMVVGQTLKVFDLAFAELFEPGTQMKGEIVRIDIQSLGLVLLSITSWRTYDCDDMEDFSPSAFEEVWKSVHGVEYCIGGSIIAQCLTNVFKDMKEVWKAATSVL